MTIKYHTVPNRLSGSHNATLRVQSAPGRFLLTVDRVGRFLAVDGETILVDPDPTTSDDALVPFLCGPLMAAILQQRHRLVLRASAVASGLDCVVFSGVSGIGKSTLTTALYHRGYRVLADDVCAIVLDSREGIVVAPGFSQVSLWPDSLRELGFEPDALTRVRPGVDKRVVSFTKPTSRSYAIRQMYELTVSSVEKPQCACFEGRGQKLMAVKRSIYGNEHLVGLGLELSSLAHISSVVSGVPIKRVVRPRRGFNLEELMSLVCGR